MKKILILLLPFFVIFFLIFAVIASLDDESNNYEGNYVTFGLSEQVLAYMELVEYYCNLYEIPEYVYYILAIMMVESGGNGSDVMQASESLGLPPNSLTPEQSIQQGVYYFSQAIKMADQYECDVWTAVQAYNFGITGYVRYISNNGNNHTIELAETYSREVVAPSLGNTSGETYRYSDPIAVAYNGGYLYRNGGNFFYAEKVRSYLAYELTDEFGEIVIEEALKYTGFPYVFEGTAPYSFDCSALTQWCYKVAGVNIPRTAQGQYDAMTHITLEEAEPGDLVFFHSTYNAGRYITHVGIYVGGNMMFHAGDPIGYADLNSTYYQNHYVCAGTVRY